jgi:hypothetical protein
MPSILYKIKIIAYNDQEVRSQIPEARPPDQEPTL